jgi:hypothetical protein
MALNLRTGKLGLLREEVFAPMRLGVLCGLVIALSCSTLTASAQPRLQWQVESSSWHRNCAFAPHEPGDASPEHRFVLLQAHLTSFAPQDASLYAVFLKDRRDLAPVEKELAKDTRLLTAKNDLRALWLPLDPNGSFTLRVDEADRHGKNWVAVVNGKGEVLGVHALWATGDVADQGRNAPKNPS